MVGDYRCVVGRGLYKAGDLVAYIPEGSILSDKVLDALGMRDSSLLAGRERNRVKAVRLRGALSQGVCYPVPANESGDPAWGIGQDVAAILGVTKWEPPIPTHMAGELANVGTEHTVRYDIDNVKWFPGAVADGEPVVMTEKIHGTWTQIGVLPEGESAHPEVGDVVVTSKGFGDKGLAFKDNAANAHNLYLRVARHLDMRQRVREARAAGVLPADQPVYVLGETFGIQDLKYGANPAKDETLGFRVFDVYVGVPQNSRGRYLDDARLDEVCAGLGLPRVPIVYRGPYSKEIMLQHTSGKETVTGLGLHIREGVVVKPVVERQDFTTYPTGRAFPCDGRVQFKSVSADYDLRKGSGGEEPTEFQ
jgi:RNA ligase (TIGR02306 family)